MIIKTTEHRSENRAVCSYYNVIIVILILYCAVAIHQPPYRLVSCICQTLQDNLHHQSHSSFLFPALYKLSLVLLLLYAIRYGQIQQYHNYIYILITKQIW